MEKNTTMFNKKYLVVFIVLLVALMTISVAADVTNQDTKAKVTKDTSKVTEAQKVVKTTENTKKIKTNKKDNITSKKTNSKQTGVKKNNYKKIKSNGQTVELYVSDNSGSDTNSGTINSPFKTLQKAIDQTTSDSSYNIHIKEGTYKGAGNTNLTVNGNYNINFIGDNVNKSVFDGEAKYDINTIEYHWQSSDIWSFYENHTGNYFMTINKGNGLISMTNFTIQNMYSAGGSAISAYKHSTIDNYANLKVTDMRFIKNHAGVGSAIRNNDGATLTVNNSFFENNRKSSSTGNDGIIYNNGSATITNSLFNHNYARWGTILNDKNITITNTTLSNNIGYDGKSTFKYGAGIAYNTGGADFYLPGYFITYTTINNCTFINNDQTDIYGYAGNLNATKNKFINSTGIYINDTMPEKIHDTLIENNIFQNIQGSTLQNSLSDSNKNIIAINALNNNNLIINNNTFTSNNGTMINATKAIITNNIINLSTGLAVLIENNSIIEHNDFNRQIIVNGSENTIKYNEIKNDDEYSIYLSDKSQNNIITNNKLISKNNINDQAISIKGTSNIIENNMGTNIIYVSPDVTNPDEGTRSKPTTINDALSKISDDTTIYLLKGETGTYSLDSTIIISANTIPSSVNKFKILGENITLDGQNQIQIMNIASNINLTIENVTFIQGKSVTDSGALSTATANINLINVNFINNTGKSGAAVYINNKNLNFKLNGTNNFINNTATGNGGTLFLKCLSNINGTNNFINNTGSAGGVIWSNTDITIDGFNYFINNTGNNGGSIYASAYLTIYGVNSFINNNATNGADIYFNSKNMVLNITGTNIFVNSTATTGSIYITQNTGIIDIQNAIFNSTMTKSAVIYSKGNSIIKNNSFINCISEDDTLILLNTNNILNENTFINSTIGLNIVITLDESTTIPIQLNDVLTVKMDVEITNPGYYDQNLLEKHDIKYNIHRNNEIIKTIDEKINNFNINADKVDEFIIYISTNTNSKSNTLILDVEQDHLKNVYLTATIPHINYNNSANLIVTTYDKSGNIVNDGLIQIYGKNNQLLGQNNINNGIANITTIPINDLGNYEITIKYLSNQTYNNQTNTSYIIITSDDVYASPDANTNGMGTKDNPTTLEDAVTKINNNGVIHLLYGKDGIYYLNNTIIVNPSIVEENVRNITFKSEEEMVTIDAQSKTNIMEISSEMTINLENIKFINSINSAITNNGTLILKDNIFYNNTGENGGAINSIGLITIIGENQFINNTARPVMQQRGGGAIYSTNNINITGKNLFINNTAIGNSMIWGGAILGKITINGENIFENNKVISTSIAYGGALYSNGTLIIIGENKFTSNVVEDSAGSAYGGAIYTIKELNISGNNYFSNNNATRGGSIYKGGTTTPFNITGNNIFTNCYSEEQGAIICTADSSINITGNNIFSNSKSNNMGGAIYLYGNNYMKPIIIISGCIFENTSAQEGGAIYTINTFNEITITNNTFKNIQSNNETININQISENMNINENKYINSSIGITEFIIKSDLENQIIIQNTPIEITIESLSLLYPDFYDKDLNKQIMYYIVVNEKNKHNSTDNPITIQELYDKETNGKLTIYAQISENNKSNNITVTIERPLETSIEITTPNENTVNKTTPITIIIKDENGQIIPGVEVTISTANKNETITLENGVIVYNYTPTTVGTETITLTYAGNNTLNPSNQTATFKVTVNKDEVIEELTNTTQEQEKTITKQENTIKEEQKKVDTLNKTVETQKQDIEKLEEKVEKLTEKTKTKLTISKATATVGKKVTIKVTVKDANGKAVTGGKVSLKVNGKVLKDSNNNIIYADVNKGVASIKYLVPGSWIKQNPKIQAIYTGNDKYADSTVTKTKLVKVNKGSTTITLTPNIKSTKAGQKVTITVKHIDTNTKKGLTSKVAVKVNGKTFKVKVKNGEGVLTYTVPAGMNAKTVKVTASHSSKYYNKATSKTSFKVTKTTPTIKTTKTTYKSKKTTIKGKILDANNKVLTKNVKVTVKVDGKVVLKNKVVKKGKINLSFKKSLKKGYHELVITSKATKAFNKASFTGVLKV